MAPEIPTSVLPPGVASRAAAADLLHRWLTKGDFPDRMAPDTPDRAFVMDLVFRVVRMRRTLDWAMAPRLKRNPEALVRVLLWMGACQLLLNEGTPDHAAIAATVETTRQLRRPAVGYVNAILRGIQRDRRRLQAELVRQPPGIRLSHPDRLLKRWIGQFGHDKTEALCVWNNLPAVTVLAALDRGPDATALLKQLQSAGIEGVEPHAACPDRCLVLPRGVRVDRLPGFREGAFVVQDPAALAAVELLDLKPGLRVLDACAAPGGKAAQIAARIGSAGRLTAVDLHADRLDMLKSNVERLRLPHVRILQTDAEGCDRDALGGPFDRILIDAPCSNTGVLRRRPDARWRFNLARLKQLVAHQQRLLANLYPALAPGGRLVYATCSLEPEENAWQVDTFLAENAGVCMLDCVSRHPVDHGTDGMFAAAIGAR